ncbi:MAG: universal stress protein [Actinomycetota bacterium]|jgi:nucleotide-binding universal stress UspA family protein|nr:universal stress protein [Actinomycetota bacterium]
MTEATEGRGRAFRRILVGYDGSKEAQEALRTAVALGAEVDGEVRVLLVIRPRPHAETPQELANAASAERDNLSQGLEALLEREEGRVADIRAVFADDPARAIAEHAEEHGFDMVVVGCHGREHLAHRGVGQSLEALLLHHPCPVLVV